MTRMEQIEHTLDRVNGRLELAHQDMERRMERGEAVETALMTTVNLLLDAVELLAAEVKAIDRVVTQLANEHR